MIRRLRDVLLIDLALVNAWHLIVAAGRYWSARQGIEQASGTGGRGSEDRGVSSSALPAPAVCPACAAPIERNRDLGYVTCSMGGPWHFYRWVSEDE